MARRSADIDLWNQLNTLAQLGAAGDLSDGQLLHRFLTVADGGSDAAFAALVERHGPMVLRVCHQTLGDRHSAEDAFQATFLVLASRADSVRKTASLASWLHGVALRVGARTKAEAARRRAYERRSVAIKAADPSCEEGRLDSWPELHEEIGRLPDCYRETVVLCYLEGMSTEAVAFRMGCPKGTVLSRLSRARERLRRRLSRRGLMVVAALLGPEAAPEAIGAVLLNSTVRSSLMFAGRRAAEATLTSATTIGLARGVLYAMTIYKLKTWVVATMIFAVGAVVGAVGLAGGHNVPRVMAQNQPPRLQPSELSPPVDVELPASEPPPTRAELAQSPVTPRSQPPVHRYQVSAWSLPASTSASPGVAVAPPSHWAYILDTQSGKLWLTKDGGKPKAIGSVE